MAQKAQTINFKVPVISVDNGAFRGNRSPASQIEKIFPTITKDGDGSFTNSLIENAYLPLLVDSYGNEFENCDQLRTINIPLAKGEMKQWFCSNYTSGDYVDTAMANIRNGATRATIIIKAAEDTAYNGATYAAGDTILTSTPEAST